MPRLALLALALVLALGVAGCGREAHLRTVGETEGFYIDLGDLRYQVQISRQLNPADAEDRAYLRGLPEGTQPPDADETWFAVFVRVANATDEEQRPADEFLVVDSDEREYPALLLDPEENPFAYAPEPIPGGGLLPNPDSPAGTGPIQGALLLFKVTVQSLQNRPVEFVIRSSVATGEGRVSLDV